MTAEDRIWAKNTETKKQAVLQKYRYRKHRVKILHTTAELGIEPRTSQSVGNDISPEPTGRKKSTVI